MSTGTTTAASAISPQGTVRYQLKTPWRNGTTHVEFEPIEFIAKLAALVPPPRAHLTRFHGVFAPNANLRAQLTPSGRGKRLPSNATQDTPPEPADPRTPDDPAGPRSARCRESAGTGCALPSSAPALCRNPAREHPIRAQTGACAAATYPPDCSKRVFEFPILTTAV